MGQREIIKAHISGPFDNVMNDAINILREKGCRVKTLPVIGQTEICISYKEEGVKQAIRITDLLTLDRFLKGEEIPRSMWTLV